MTVFFLTMWQSLSSKHWILFGRYPWHDVAAYLGHACGAVAMPGTGGHVFFLFPSLVFSVHCNSNVAVWILLVCFFTGHLCNGELFRPCRCRKRKHLYQYHLITPTEGKGLCANKPLAWNNGWVWCHGVIVFGCALSPASPSSRPLPASHTAHC